MRKRNALCVKWVVVMALAFTFHLSPFTLNAQMAVGSWRDCLDYSSVYKIQAVDNYIFAASRGGVFRFDTDEKVLEYFSKSTGINEKETKA